MEAHTSRLKLNLKKIHKNHKLGREHNRVLNPKKKMLNGMAFKSTSDPPKIV